MGGKTISTGSPKINQLTIQSSSLGVALPRGWGTGRVKCNLMWYGAFRAIATTTKQKGKGAPTISNTTYSYTASMMLGLCSGPIDGVRTVYRDKEVFGSPAAAGLSIALGTPDQATWGYLTSMHPDQALNYSRTAYAYASDYPLTDSATLRNHSFEVQFGSTVPGLDDANPRTVTTELLTDPVHGVPGWTLSMIGDLTNWSNYCLANDLLLSPIMDQQRPASEVLSDLGTATNTEIFWSEGQLKAVPYGDAPASANSTVWEPNLTPVYDLTEDDFHVDGDEAPVVQEIVDQSDAYNVVQIEYLDRANQYNTAIQPAVDLDNVMNFGERKKDPLPLHAICRSSVASTVAQLLLARTLYRREKYRFRLPWNYVLLEPMDYVTLTTVTDELQLNRVLVQIESIDEDDEDGVLDIVAEGVSSGSAAAALYASHSGSGYYQDTSQLPGSVTDPVLLNAPMSLTGGEPEVWCAAGSDSPTWGGCEVWISADNVSYRLAGVINGGARYGVSTSSLALAADPDPTGSLGVDLTSSAGELLSGSDLDLSVAATLCSVGSELVAYKNAVLTSAGNYTLSGLRRGLYGTTPQAHASGAPFVRIDDSLLKIPYGDMAVGKTLYVKFASFNVWAMALEDISELAPYTIDLLPQFTTSTGALANYTLIPTAGLYISGQSVRKITSTDVFDESVRSAEAYTNGAAVHFRPLRTDAGLILGLSQNPEAGVDNLTIDYGLICRTDGTLLVTEDGTFVDIGYPAYASGDRMGVVYNGQTVIYTQNGTVLRTVSVPQGMTLHLDSSFRTEGAEAQSVTFSSIGTPGVSAVVGYLSNESTTLPATSAGVVTNYSDATGTFYLSDGGVDVIGLATFSVHSNPQGLTNSTGPIINSSGVYRIDGGFDEATASLVLKAVYDGQTIYKTLSLTQSRAGTNGTSPPLLSIQAGRQTFTYLASGVPSPAGQTSVVSVVRQNLAGTAVFTIKRVDGATVASPDTYLAGSGDGRTLSQASFDAARGSTNGIQITATVGALSDTITIVAVANGADGTNGLPGAPGANGTTFYTWYAYADSADGQVNFTTGSPNTRVFQGISPGRTSAVESTNPADYTWSPYAGPPNFGLAAANGGEVAGAKIVRRSGGLWESQVYSTESFTGGAFVSFKPEVGNDAVMVGLNTDPTTASWESLDYALYLEAGNVYAAEGGVLTFLTTYVAATDTFAVHYDGANVRYSKNGVVLRTVSAAANTRFYLDSAMSNATGVKATITAWAAAGTVGTPGAPGSPGAPGAPGSTGATGASAIGFVQDSWPGPGMVNQTWYRPSFKDWYRWDGANWQRILGDLSTQDIISNSAYIGDLVVITGKIANLAVDTIKIAGNAVTTPVGAFTAAATSPNTTSWTTIQSVVIGATGAPILALSNFYAVYYADPGTPALEYRLLRNGGQIYGPILVGQNGLPYIEAAFPIQVIDSPGAGTWTYELQFRDVNNGNIGSVSHRSIALIELKK